MRIFCAHLNISQAQLARASGSTPQNLNNKLRANTLTPDDLKRLAEAVGCRYECAFILPDGQRVTY